MFSKLPPVKKKELEVKHQSSIRILVAWFKKIRIRNKTFQVYIYFINANKRGCDIYRFLIENLGPHCFLSEYKRVYRIFLKIEKIKTTFYSIFETNIITNFRIPLVKSTPWNSRIDIQQQTKKRSLG